MPSPTAVERLAAGVLGLEALALLVVAGWELVALVGGDTGDVASAIALIVLTVVGAVAVAAFAVAVWRARSWGRSGGIVTQLLILSVALGAITGASPAVGTAVLLAVPAAIGLVVLILAVRVAGARGREEAGDAGDADG